MWWWLTILPWALAVLVIASSGMLIFRLCKAFADEDWPRVSVLCAPFAIAGFGFLFASLCAPGIARFIVAALAVPNVYSDWCMWIVCIISGFSVALLLLAPLQLSSSKPSAQLSGLASYTVLALWWPIVYHLALAP